MAILIKTINKHILIEFDKGKFDEWCIYLTKNGNRRYAPLDTEYFGRLKELAEIYSTQKIFSDFLMFYHATDNQLNDDILKLIDILSAQYDEYAEEINVWFTIIYAGMVAEENKANAILKKRVKRLGMYQVLIQNYEPEYAANFSKGKNWRELDLVMKDLGI